MTPRTPSSQYEYHRDEAERWLAEAADRAKRHPGCHGAYPKSAGYALQQAQVHATLAAAAATWGCAR
jgi:hypothetical protein